MMSSSMIERSPLTQEHLGRRVMIGGEKTGVLKFIGQIDPKPGTFCGIELDQPVGKNDGSLAGKIYFACKPGHGIFAPPERIGLLPASHASSASSTSTSADDLFKEEPLCRSDTYLQQFTTPLAAPFVADASATLFPETSPVPGPVANKRISLSDLMDFDEPGITEEEPPTGLFRVSISSVASPNSDPERRISDTSLPSHEEEGAFGPSPDEVTEPEQTPVTEEAPLDEFLRLEKSSKFEEDRPTSTMSADTGYHGDTDTSMGGRATVSPPTAMDQSTEENTLTAASTPSVEQAPELPTSDSRKRGGADNKSNRRTYTLEKSPFASAETQQPSNSSPKPKRRLLVQSDKPNLKSPAAVAASRPPKAKTPSKSQAIMEKLKASIEAEKSRPKKEVQRISLLPPPASKTKGKIPEECEEMPSRQAPSTSGPVATPKARQSLLPPKTTKPVPAKPRTSLLPPKAPAAKVLKESVEPKALPSKLPRSRTGSVSSATSRDSSACAARKASALASSTSATNCKEAPSKPSVDSKMGPPAKSKKVPPTRTATATATAASCKAKHDLEKEKAAEEKHRLEMKLKTGQRRLTYVCQSFDAMSIVSRHVQSRLSNLEESSSRVYQELSNARSHIDELIEEKRQLGESHTAAIERLHQEHATQCRDELAKLSNTHEEYVQKIGEQYMQKEAKALEELKMEHETRLRALQDEHETQMHAVQNKHKAQSHRLSNRIKDAENEIVKLKEQKSRLEETLSKNASEKEQRLSAEVRSLQDVLDMKRAEVRDLRQLQGQLELQVADIPEKDMEIQKLRHRVEQLQETVESKADREKTLISKFDELQKSAYREHQVKQSLAQDKEMLEYKLKELTPARPDLHNQTQFYTPRDNLFVRPARVHSSFSESEHSPMLNGHAATSSSTVEQPDVMTRSALSYVQEQGRKRLSYQPPSQRTGTTIYAPEGIWDTERDSDEFDADVAARRGLSFESNSNPDSPRSANEGVSVRRASEKAVLDSGIFSSMHSVPDVDEAADKPKTD